MTLSIIRVHFGFSLVENSNLLEDRRTLAPFQRQANHSNVLIVFKNHRQAMACFVFVYIMITSNGVLKSFRCTTKLILAQAAQFSV